jgi:16S rRNA (cytosine967-C5)-methyltransferase
MAQKQRQMVNAGLALLAPGGTLLYTTCSVELEENEGLVTDVPNGYENQELASRLPVGVPSNPTDAGGIRLLPNPNGDGFTMHAIRRTA